MAKQEIEIESVKMLNGTVVDFAGKKRMIVSELENPPAVQFDFRNGETRTFALNQDLMLKYALHGAKQKYADEVAGMKDPATGQNAELDDLIAAMEALDERLKVGDWKMARDGGSGFAGASIVIKALMEVTKKTKQEIQAYIEGKLASTEGLTRAGLYKAIRNSATYGPVVKRLEDEKDAKSKVQINADEIMQDLA